MTQAPERPPSRLQALLAGAPGWVGGVLTGVQAAVIGLLVVITPAFAAAAAAPTTNGSAAIDWMGVAQIGTRLWLLAHGVPYIIEGVAFTLVPLALTAIVAVALVGIARRFCTKSWASWAIATGTYTGIVVFIETLAMRGYPELAANTMRTVVVTLIVAGPSIAAGIWRAHGAEFGWVPSIPLMVRQGLRLGVASTAAALSAAAVVAGGFVYLGRGRIADAVAALGIDPIGGAALAFAQALYAPNMTVWMLGWMTGQGFAVGEGSLYAPSQVSAEPVPAFPLLGALPTIAGGWIAWAPVAIVAIAAVARIALRGRISTHVEDFPAIGIALCVTFLVVGGLGVIASGAMGPGRLASVGVEVLPTAVTFAILSALGFAIGHGLLLLARLAFGGRQPEPLLHVVPQDERVATPT